MIGLVSCSSQKLNHAAIARRLYSSPLFQKSLAYAERRCMAVYVLSAAHGLVHADDFIEPYNRRLGRKDERRQWGARTAAALVSRHLKHEDLLLLAGEDYAAPLQLGLRLHGWTGYVHQPLAGMQVGERLRWLNAELERMPLQLPAPGGAPEQRAAALWVTPRPEGALLFHELAKVAQLAAQLQESVDERAAAPHPFAMAASIEKALRDAGCHPDSDCCGLCGRQRREHGAA